jgi:hypothetical protein
MKFRVTYSNGTTQEVESSDCSSVEAFCNSHFGSAWDEAKANGAMVEVVTDAATTETKEYSDGTTATGPAPLPDESPAQQDAREVQELPVVDTPPAAPAAPAKTVKKTKK